jgi:hypothetical protein
MKGDFTVTRYIRQVRRGMLQVQLLPEVRAASARECTFSTQLRVSKRADWTPEPHLLDIIGEARTAVQASDVSVTTTSGSEGTCEVSMPAAEYEVNDYLEHCIDPKMARRAPNASTWIGMGVDPGRRITALIVPNDQREV